MSVPRVDEKYLYRGVRLIRKGVDEEESRHVDEMSDLLVEVAEVESKRWEKQVQKLKAEVDDLNVQIANLEGQLEEADLAVAAAENV